MTTLRGCSLRAAFLAFFCLGLSACMGPVPVDVVMADKTLYFVLEEPMEIRAISVAQYAPGGGKGAAPAWALRHDLTTEVKKRKYPRLKQIEYGQKLPEFPVVAGPAELQKNVEYQVNIDLGNKFAREVFLLTDDGKAVMPRPSFARQKGRVYTLLTEKDGTKKLIPAPNPR